MADQQTRQSRNEDARKAVRFLAIKAAIFILLPLAAAVVAAMVMLK